MFFFFNLLLSLGQSDPHSTFKLLEILVKLLIYFWNVVNSPFLGPLMCMQSFNMFWMVKLDGVELTPIGFHAIWKNQHFEKLQREKQFMWNWRLVFWIIQGAFTVSISKFHSRKSVKGWFWWLVFFFFLDNSY